MEENKHFMPSADCKEKSILAKIKNRRRSNVGVRGSPETNSLICFIAKKTMESQLVVKKPEVVRSSSYLPRVASTLTEKMASFENLISMSESNDCDLVPAQDFDGGQSIRPRDFQCDQLSCSEDKENNPLVTPTPNKRRCYGLLKTCASEITEAKTPVSLKHLEKQNDFCLNEPPASTPQHPESPTRPIPPLLDQTHAVEEEFPMASTADKQKKQVRFGEPLSPELFDKNLPPSTPLQKGGTPSRPQTPGTSLQLRSLLKTPQLSQPEISLSELDNSHSEFDSCPVLKIPRKHATPAAGGDGEKTEEKIVFSPMEEIASTSDSGFVFDSRPLNLDKAFYEESLLQPSTECTAKPNKSPKMNELPECDAQEKQPETESSSPVPHSKKTRKQKQPAKAPSKSRRKKREQSEDSKPVKRLTRSASKTSCGTKKASSTVNRRWNKKVDRSLYGSREYASKNPTLSPIIEGSLLDIQQTPTDPNQQFFNNPEVSDDTEALADLAVNESLEKPFASPVFPKGKRDWMVGVTVRKREEKKNICISWPEVHTENFEDQTTSRLEASSGNLSKHSEPGQEEANDEELCAQTSSDTSYIAVVKSADNLHAPLSHSLEESSFSETECKRAKKGRRSCMLQQLQIHKDPQTSCVKGTLGEQKVNQHEIITLSKIEEQMTHDDLPHWQADFNCEDVFQPVATRGQRSVRRSLRNQSDSSSSLGLAWLPHTSPDTVRETRRRTRGRRHSATLLSQPPPAEESQHISLDEEK